MSTQAVERKERVAYGYSVVEGVSSMRSNFHVWRNMNAAMLKCPESVAKMVGEV